MAKKNEMTLGKLLEDLKQVPYRSDEYKKVRKGIVKRIAEKYPNQFVLCVPNKFDADNDGQFYTRLSSLPEVTSVEAMPHLVSNQLTFFQSKEFTFERREDVEYNYAWKQVNVFGFITDGSKYIVLQKRENDEVTMVGGHVDYSMEAYQMSQLAYLRLSLQKEVDEEIQHGKRIEVPERPIVLVNTFNKFNDIFHMAFIYRIQVNDVDKVFEMIASGEPNKHSVTKFDSKDELLREKKINPWFEKIGSYL